MLIGRCRRLPLTPPVPSLFLALPSPRVGSRLLAPGLAERELGPTLCSALRGVIIDQCTPFPGSAASLSQVEKLRPAAVAGWVLGRPTPTRDPLCELSPLSKHLGKGRGEREGRGQLAGLPALGV